MQGSFKNANLWLKHFGKILCPFFYLRDTCSFRLKNASCSLVFIRRTFRRNKIRIFVYPFFTDSRIFPLPEDNRKTYTESRLNCAVKTSTLESEGLSKGSLILTFSHTSEKSQFYGYAKIIPKGRCLKLKVKNNSVHPNNYLRCKLMRCF